MKKLDNFSSCLDVLWHANFEFAKENEIYRTGIIWQFNLTLAAYAEKAKCFSASLQ